MTTKKAMTNGFLVSYFNEDTSMSCTYETAAQMAADLITKTAAGWCVDYVGKTTWTNH